MVKTSVLVVEDEAIVSKDIQQSLRKLGYTISGSSSTGISAVELARTSEPDVVLMDIMLKGSMTGIEAAAMIRKNLSIPVIYLTAYADESTLLKARVAEPFGYIIKPFKEIDLQTSIEIAVYKYQKERERNLERNVLASMVDMKETVNASVFIRTNGQLIRVLLQDILYLEALKDYVIIHLHAGSYTIHSTMKEIESRLGTHGFLRVHRSYIIQVDKITSIDSSNLTLENVEVVIPIGGLYKDALYKRINLI
jgi:two-component system response regulator LytT